MDLTVYRALAFSPSLHPKRIFNFSIKCANGTWTRTTGLSLKKPIRYLYSEIAVWICFNILHHRFKRSLEVLKRRKALVILLDYIALTKGSTILSISSPNEYCQGRSISSVHSQVATITHQGIQLSACFSLPANLVCPQVLYTTFEGISNTQSTKVTPGTWACQMHDSFVISTGYKCVIAIV